MLVRSSSRGLHGHGPVTSPGKALPLCLGQYYKKKIKLIFMKKSNPELDTYYNTQEIRTFLWP
jgi:hypothetical protein